MSPDIKCGFRRTALILPFGIALTVAVLASGCRTRPPREKPASSSAAPASTAPANLQFNLSDYALNAGGQRIEVKEQDVAALGEQLPPPIRMRQALSIAKSAEWQALIAVSRDPSTVWNKDVSVETIKGWVHHLRASDGVEFIVDNQDMALWVRAANAPWTCVLYGANIRKTMGGIAAHLPVCYVGQKRFLIAETLPGRRYNDYGAPYSAAQSATFLIDAGTARVLARTPAVTYSQNPPLTVPAEWNTRFGFRIEPGAPAAK